MINAKTLPFVAIMAALANILSIPPIAIPLGSESSIHFSQLAIFIVGMLAGPLGGLITGAAGGLFASFVFLPRIPFIIGGLAILGLASGLFAKKFRPAYAGVLSWLVQAPYVAVTDYAWFTLFLQKTPPFALTFVMSILLILTVEVAISSALADIIIAYLKKAHITFS